MYKIKNLSKTKFEKGLLEEFLNFTNNKLKIDRPYSVYFVDDKVNAADALGKTAMYNPNSNSVYIYVTDRHPKDILRSLAHELMHHKQNCDGRLDKTYGEGSDNLETLEREANQAGYLVRQFEDNRANGLNEQEEGSFTDPTRYTPDAIKKRDIESKFKQFDKDVFIPKKDPAGKCPAGFEEGLFSIPQRQVSGLFQLKNAAVSRCALMQKYWTNKEEYRKLLKWYKAVPGDLSTPQDKNLMAEIVYVNYEYFNKNKYFVTRINIDDKAIQKTRKEKYFPAPGDFTHYGHKLSATDFTKQELYRELEQDKLEFYKKMKGRFTSNPEQFRYYTKDGQVKQVQEKDFDKFFNEQLLPTHQTFKKLEIKRGIVADAIFLEIMDIFGIIPTVGNAWDLYSGVQKFKLAEQYYVANGYSFMEKSFGAEKGGARVDEKLIMLYVSSAISFLSATILNPILRAAGRLIAKAGKASVAVTLKQVFKMIGPTVGIELTAYSLKAFLVALAEKLPRFEGDAARAIVETLRKRLTQLAGAATGEDVAKITFEELLKKVTFYEKIADKIAETTARAVIDRQVNMLESQTPGFVERTLARYVGSGTNPQIGKIVDLESISSEELLNKRIWTELAEDAGFNEAESDELWAFVQQNFENFNDDSKKQLLAFIQFFNELPLKGRRELQPKLASQLSDLGSKATAEQFDKTANNLFNSYVNKLGSDFSQIMQKDSTRRQLFVEFLMEKENNKLFSKAIEDEMKAMSGVVTTMSGQRASEEEIERVIKARLAANFFPGNDLYIFDPKNNPNLDKAFKDYLFNRVKDFSSKTQAGKSFQLASAGFNSQARKLGQNMLDPNITDGRKKAAVRKFLKGLEKEIFGKTSGDFTWLNSIFRRNALGRVQGPYGETAILRTGLAGRAVGSVATTVITLVPMIAILVISLFRGSLRKRALKVLDTANKNYWTDLASAALASALTGARFKYIIFSPENTEPPGGGGARGGGRSTTTNIGGLNSQDIFRADLSDFYDGLPEPAPTEEGRKEQAPEVAKKVGEKLKARGADPKVIADTTDAIKKQKVPPPTDDFESFEIEGAVEVPGTEDTLPPEAGKELKNNTEIAKKEGEKRAQQLEKLKTQTGDTKPTDKKADKKPGPGEGDKGQQAGEAGDYGGLGKADSPFTLTEFYNFVNQINPANFNIDPSSQYYKFPKDIKQTELFKKVGKNALPNKLTTVTKNYVNLYREKVLSTAAIQDAFDSNRVKKAIKEKYGKDVNIKPFPVTDDKASLNNFRKIYDWIVETTKVIEGLSEIKNEQTIKSYRDKVLKERFQKLTKGFTR